MLLKKLSGTQGNMPSYNDFEKHTSFPGHYRTGARDKQNGTRCKDQVHSTCPEGELRFVALSCNGFDKQKRAFHDTTTAGPTEISKKRPIGAYIIKFI